MIDCICELGKKLSETQIKCPHCGIDLTPLHRIHSLPTEFFNEGKKLHRNRKSDEAIDFFVTTITLDPHYIDAYIKLYKIYSEKNLFNKAFLIIERGLIHNPENVLLLQAKAELLVQNVQIGKNKKVDLPVPSHPTCEDNSGNQKNIFPLESDKKSSASSALDKTINFTASGKGRRKKRVK